MTHFTTNILPRLSHLPVYSSQKKLGENFEARREDDLVLFRAICYYGIFI